MKERLKALGARLWPFALVALLGFAGGFFLGRKGPSPDSVTEKSHVEENSHGEETTEVKAAQKVQETTTQAKRRKVTAKTVTDKKADGTVHTVRTVEVADQADTRTDTASNSTATAQDSSETTRKLLEDKSKVTVYRRDWKAGVLLGGELQNPLTHQFNPFSSPLVGLTFERRLNFIPVVGDRMWLGAWGLVNVGPQVKGHYWFVGMSLGVEF